MSIKIILYIRFFLGGKGNRKIWSIPFFGGDDRYGSQEPIALLKQLFEFGGLFDRANDLRWKFIRDLSFYAAMGSPGGGRNDIDRRFLSKFFILYIPPPSDLILKYIYTSILRGHFAEFTPAIQLITDVIIQMTLNLLRVGYRTSPSI